MIQRLGRHLDPDDGLVAVVFKGQLDLGIRSAGRREPLTQIGDHQRQVIANQGQGGLEAQADPLGRGLQAPLETLEMPAV